MGVRAIRLRRRGRCRSCRTELWPGATAYYDDATHRLTCASCALGDRPTLFEEVTGPARDPIAAAADARRHPTPAERDRVRALIADARAALHSTPRAS